MDEMVKYLSNKKGANKHVGKLANWMDKEEYDSDTLKYDINNVGNILNHVENKGLAVSIKNVFAAMKSMIFFL